MPTNKNCWCFKNMVYNRFEFFLKISNQIRKVLKLNSFKSSKAEIKILKLKIGNR